MAVHNNPDSMEAFAGALGNFIRDIQNAMSALNGAYSTLGDDWQDAKKSEFDENMAEIQRSIVNFSDFSDESIKYLLHKAQQLRDYLDS
jgi:hypothetical protein